MALGHCIDTKVPHIFVSCRFRKEVPKASFAARVVILLWNEHWGYSTGARCFPLRFFETQPTAAVTLKLSARLAPRQVPGHQRTVSQSPPLIRVRVDRRELNSEFNDAESNRFNFSSLTARTHIESELN